MTSCRRLPAAALGLLAALCLAVASSRAVRAGDSCDRTVAPGADLAAAVASAPNDSTICLATGLYGTVVFEGIERSGYVTLQSADGRLATISPQVRGSSFLAFQSLTLGGGDDVMVSGCSQHIRLVDSTFANGLFVTSRGDACAAGLDILVDRDSFGDLEPATYEGRLSVAADDGNRVPMGLTISHSTFGPGCRSDGIQLVGGAGGVTIGPGNIFDGIEQTEGGVHCDMIQFYSDGPPSAITGNWFRNGSVALTHHTAAPGGTRFTDNVISNVAQLQVGQSANFVFEHNTIYNLTDAFTINSESTNAVIRNNIFAGNTSLTTDDVGHGACVDCLVSHMLCDDAEQCLGTNQIVAVPRFAGGAAPATWAGWQLLAVSPGKSAASDGRDVGTTFYGAAQPQPPTDVRIVR
jgi:hypothetical protein